MAEVQEVNDFEGFTNEIHVTAGKIRTELLKTQNVPAKESEKLLSDNKEDEKKNDQHDPSVFDNEKLNNDDNYLSEDTTLECGKKHKRNEKNADENPESVPVADELSPGDWRPKNEIETHLAPCITEDTKEKTEEQNLSYCHTSESKPLTLQAYCNGRKYTKPCLEEFEGFTRQESEHSKEKKNAYLKAKRGLGGSQNAHLTQAQKWTVNLQEKLTKQDRQQLWEMKDKHYYIMSHIFVNDHIEWLKMSLVMLKQTFSNFPKNFTQYQDLVELEVAVCRALIFGSGKHQQLTTKDLYSSLHPVIRNKISEVQMQKLLVMSPLYYYNISKKVWQITSEMLETGKTLIYWPIWFLLFVTMCRVSLVPVTLQ